MTSTTDFLLPCRPLGIVDDLLEFVDMVDDRAVDMVDDRAVDMVDDRAVDVGRVVGGCSGTLLGAEDWDSLILLLSVAVVAVVAAAVAVVVVVLVVLLSRVSCSG